MPLRKWAFNLLVWSFPKEWEGNADTFRLWFRSRWLQGVVTSWKRYRKFVYKNISYIPSMGLVYLPTWMVDVYMINVRKCTIPIDGIGIKWWHVFWNKDQWGSGWPSDFVNDLFVYSSMHSVYYPTDIKSYLLTWPGVWSNIDQNHFRAQKITHTHTLTFAVTMNGCNYRVIRSGDFGPVCLPNLLSAVHHPRGVERQTSNLRNWFFGSHESESKDVFFVFNPINGSKM